MKRLALLAALLLPALVLAYEAIGSLVDEYETTRAGSVVRVCVYDVGGDRLSVVIPSHKVCPVQWTFEL